MQRAPATQDELYEEATTEYAAALGRLARSYEIDQDKQRDLLQEIHFALWRSLGGFEGTCSLRTWVYRVAHNVAASHVVGQLRHRSQTLVGLDEVETTLVDLKAEAALDRQQALGRLYALIRRLRPPDRQIILLYLEGSDAASIAEITGITAGNVATRIHRIKRILADWYQTGSTT
jgi:RNA polymerase sigma-70 factor (ECF subfamily)